MAHTERFSCSIRMDKDTYSPTDPVLLLFQLTNNNDCDMYVLTWHTPLEGVRNRFLKVTVEGKDVPYRGIMVKRGPPSADSYVLVAAGETVSASVDIREGYSTETCGRYSVLLDTGGLMDVVPRKEGVDFAPNGFDGFTSVDISCGPVEFDIV